MSQRLGPLAARTLTEARSGSHAHMLDWEALGSIGEVVGALGVLVTLGFLVYQLRQNTRALRAEGFRNVAVMIHHPTTLMVQDPEVASIHARGNDDYTSLDPVERDRYHYLVIQRLHAIEMLTHYNRAGLAEDWLYDSGALIVVRLARRPGFQQWWHERGCHLFGLDFRDWVQGMVDQNPA